MEKFEWIPEQRKPKSYELSGDKLKAWNTVLTETAGFIPLEVRFKQMEQAGYRARFFESEFSSKDVTDMYLNHPEFDITPEDDFEDMVEKMQLRNSYIEEVKTQVRKRNAATDSKLRDSETKAQQSESAANAEEKDKEK